MVALARGMLYDPRWPWHAAAELGARCRRRRNTGARSRASTRTCSTGANRMNGATLSLGLAIIAGVLIAVQAPTNALLGKASGSPIVAAFISFIVGSLALGAVVAATQGKLFSPALKQVPWYAWIGGFYGAFFVAVAAFVAPRVGIGVLLTAAVAGQLAAALVLDHYGLLGLAKHPVTITRAAGFLLVVAGAALVRRS